MNCHVTEVNGPEIPSHRTAWLAVHRAVGDNEAVDEVAGREAEAHGFKCAEEAQEIRSVTGGKLPECFVLEDIQAKVPGSCSVLVEDVAPCNMQAGGSEPLFVIEHSVELDEHAVFYGTKELPVFVRRQ